MNATPPETHQDRVLAFTLADRDARGRVVRLDEALNTILEAHAYPPAIQHLLAEALVLTALIGSLTKESGSQLTMQAQNPDGIVSLLVCDFREGELRGYAQYDADRLSSLGSNPSLQRLFGEAYLAITFDLIEGGERYQGIVPLEGGTLSEACEQYFDRSEQVPTLIRAAVRRDAAGKCIAGGILAQHMPEGEEGGERLQARADQPHWEHVSIIAGSVRHDELVDRSLSLESVVWRLFHEEPEVRVAAGPRLSRGCRCSSAYFEQVIARFPPEDRAEMRNDEGVIVVDCAFCSRLFPLEA